MGRRRAELHRELELLVDAGIPPAGVLVIATRNGADVAGLLDDRGTFEPGKRADLFFSTAIRARTSARPATLCG